MERAWWFRESGGRTGRWRPSTRNSSPSASASARSAAGSPMSVSGPTGSVNKFIAVVFLVLGGCPAAPSGGLERIETIVVIYAENRSFDHLYGLFPGANGIADATDEQKTQLDLDGTALPYLPPVFTPEGKPDERFPQKLSNGPFRIDAPPLNRRWDELLPSPIHAYYQNRAQINGGRNNMYVAMSNAGAFVMGYFDGSRMKLWKWAQDYTLADHFFMAAYGGSYLNHLWLVCACTPRYAGAPGREGQSAQGGKIPAFGAAGPGADVRRRGLARRLHRQYPAAAVPAERHPAGGARQPRSRRPVAPSAAAAERENHRRHAHREGRVVGLVRRRLERRHRRRSPRSARQAYGDLRARGQLQVPAAPPAVQLLRALRARHGRARAAPVGLRRPGRRHRQGDAAAGGVLQAHRPAQPAPELHRSRAGRCAPR